MIVSRYRGYGGHEIVINNLCTGLTRLGHKVTLGAFHFDKKPPVEIRSIKLGRFRWREWLNDKSYDVYHSHQPQVNYYALFGKKPFVFHFHGASNSIQELNLRLCMTLCKKKILRTFCVSNVGLKQFQRVSDSEAEVIYNGVDTSSLNPSLPVVHAKGDPQLLFVGNLYPHKNVALLVRCMRNVLSVYPKVHLQVVGSGKDYESIQSLIYRQNLQDNVQLIGNCSGAELMKRFASCDIYVSASGWEMFGLPALEAMACGKPVLLSDIPAHKELIEQSRSGLTFSLNDLTSMVQKIGEVYKNRVELGNNGRLFAEKCDWSMVCKKLSSIYDTIISSS